MTDKNKPAPKFKMGDILDADPRAADRGQPLIGPVVEMYFGWSQRDDTVLPIWVYRLDFPDAPGMPVVWFPENYLSTRT